MPGGEELERSPAALMRARRGRIPGACSGEVSIAMRKSKINITMDQDLIDYA